jgi:hypothetical protein
MRCPLAMPDGCGNSLLAEFSKEIRDACALGDAPPDPIKFAAEFWPRFKAERVAKAAAADRPDDEPFKGMSRGTGAFGHSAARAPASGSNYFRRWRLSEPNWRPTGPACTGLPRTTRPARPDRSGPRSGGWISGKSALRTGLRG